MLLKKVTNIKLAMQSSNNKVHLSVFSVNCLEGGQSLGKKDNPERESCPNRKKRLFSFHVWVDIQPRDDDNCLVGCLLLRFLTQKGGVPENLN